MSLHMKKFLMLSISFVAVTILIVACNPTQSTEKYLKDDNQRKATLTVIAHNQSYITEMMGVIMSCDSCKTMMGQSLMKDDAMSNMMMSDMMNMCEKDSLMCNKIMMMMKSKPMMMNEMNKMKKMSGMKM